MHRNKQLDKLFASEDRAEFLAIFDQLSEEDRQDIMADVGWLSLEQCTWLLEYLLELIGDVES